MKTLIKLSVCLLAFTYCKSIQAQLSSPFSIYRNAWQVINPGAIFHQSFIDDKMNNILTTSYRQQWIGTKTYNWTAHWEHIPDVKFKKEKIKMGMGFTGERDEFMRACGFYGNYAYALRLGMKTRKKMLIGMNVGVMNRALHLNANFEHPQDARIAQFANSKQNQWFGTLNPGLFYTDYTANDDYRRFYAGVSVPMYMQFAGQTVTYAPNDKNQLDWITRRAPHVNVLVGGLIESMGIYPSAWVQLGLPNMTKNMNFNVNLRKDIAKILWVGAGFSNTNILHFETGILKFDKRVFGPGGENYRLYFNLAYDLPMNFNKTSLRNTVELNVTMTWN